MIDPPIVLHASRCGPLETDRVTRSLDRAAPESVCDLTIAERVAQLQDRVAMLTVSVLPSSGAVASQSDCVTQAPGLRLPVDRFCDKKPPDLSPKRPV
jgi:hypothetical protein